MTNKQKLDEIKAIKQEIEATGARVKDLMRLDDLLDSVDSATLVCSACNTEIEVEYLDDIVECPNCGEEVSKENASQVL